jgi:hypothetical protein
MPVIEGKKIWEITALLTGMINIKDWQNFGVQAELDPNALTLEGNAYSQWSTIVKACINGEDNTKLIKLLLAIKDLHPDPKIVALLDELKTGYTTRLQKLAKALKYKQCILFLGPGVLIVNKQSEQVPFNQLLASHFAELLDNNAKYYDKSAKSNLNYMVQRYNRACNAVPGEAGNEAIIFYKKLIDNATIYQTVFEKLSKLPWNLVINTNPDTLLAQAMNEQRQDSCILNNYPLVNNMNDLSNKGIPGKEQCLFYNIFGTFDEPASILFTDSDFIRFNTKVTNKTPALNEYVTSMFDPNKEYLFLGFDFDQWYFKILFKVLNLEKEKAFSLEPGNVRFNECNIDFFEEEYKFYFVNDHIDTFLKNLNDLYKKIV